MNSNSTTATRLLALDARHTSPGSYAVVPLALSKYAGAATAQEALEQARDDQMDDNDYQCRDFNLGEQDRAAMAAQIDADHDAAAELLAEIA